MKKTQVLVILSLITIISIFNASITHATLVTLDFSGTVNSKGSSDLISDIYVGESFAGDLWYNTDAFTCTDLDYDPGSKSTVGLYNPLDDSSFGYKISIGSLNVFPGGLYIRTDKNKVMFFINGETCPNRGITWSMEPDSYIEIIDNSGGNFGDTPDGELPIIFPGSNYSGNIVLEDYGESNDIEICLSIDSVTQPVPEPATMFLLSVGIWGIAGFKKKLKKIS